jgi:phospholipase C
MTNARRAVLGYGRGVRTAKWARGAASGLREQRVTAGLRGWLRRAAVVGCGTLLSGCAAIDWVENKANEIKETVENDDRIVSHWSRGADAGPGADVLVPRQHDAGADYDIHAEERRACSVFGPGSLTTDTIGPDVPHGAALPFKHVVVLVQENHSFDNYLSDLPAAGMTDVDVASPDATNPSGPGSAAPVRRTHEPKPCSSDLNHEWEASHIQYDEGRMDGFARTNGKNGALSMQYYLQGDLPYYYWLATTFGIGDRHFSSLLGPTWPNRYFALAATSAGCTYTPGGGQIGCEARPTTTIFDRLREHVSYRVYSGNVKCFHGICAHVPLTLAMLEDPTIPMSTIESFIQDAKNGDLPQVSYLEPHFDMDSEHPPNDIRRGEALVRQIVEAIGHTDELWQHTVLFVTHDEHGGYYDHVPPPRACEPDDLRPATHAFDRLGFRVPLFVVSAYNVPSHTSHFVTDHTSILRFIENLFDLGALTRRDANAWPLLDRFDFTHMSFPKLPKPSVPDAGLPDAGCGG